MEKIDTNYKRRIEKFMPNFSRCANHDIVALRPFMAYDDIMSCSVCFRCSRVQLLGNAL